VTLEELTMMTVVQTSKFI